MIRDITFIAALIGCLTAGEAASQIPTPSAQVDSAVVEALSIGIYDGLKSSTGSLSTGESIPWTVIVKDSLSPHWGKLLRKLRSDLNTRPTLDSDERQNTIGISPLRFEGRDAVVAFSIVQEHRCKSGRWLESLVRFEVRSTWLGSGWDVGVARPTLFTDPPPCDPDNADV